MRFYIKKKTPVYAYSKELWIKENYKSIQKLIDNIDIFYDINETEKKNKGIFKYALFPE
jgi:hypothetical protein